MQPLSELLNLARKTAIVTGGAKGIGYGIGYRLAEAGASVVIADLDETAATKTATEFAAKGWKAIAVKVDVSSEPDVERMMAEAKAEFGSVDILVNNAGIYPSEPIANMSAEDFERVVHVNLRSVFLTTKHAAAAMRQAGKGGRIINISSIDALHPSMVGLAHYDASKHGVWGFTKNSALELAADKIWVNAIAPGGVETPGTTAAQGDKAVDPQVMQAFMAKIPMHRMGQPDDIGKVAVFLASDMASYMTGSQIVVDGGALLS